MVARTVNLHLKPNSVPQFTQTIDKEICESKRASRTKLPWSFQAERKR